MELRHEPNPTNQCGLHMTEQAQQRVLDAFDIGAALGETAPWPDHDYTVDTELLEWCAWTGRHAGELFEQLVREHTGEGVA